MIDPVISAISLAKKAGKAVSGEFSVMESVKKRAAKIVILASDASENTKKLFRDKCGYRNIPVVVYKDKSSLGAALGQGERSSVAILDEQFKKLLTSKINNEE